MPEEPRPKALWILNRLSADLQSARMWPVRLAHLKHQESLCNLTHDFPIWAKSYKIKSSSLHIYFGFPVSVFQPWAFGDTVYAKHWLVDFDGTCRQITWPSKKYEPYARLHSHPGLTR